MADRHDRNAVLDNATHARHIPLSKACDFRFGAVRQRQGVRGP